MSQEKPRLIALKILDDSCIEEKTSMDSDSELFDNHQIRGKSCTSQTGTVKTEFIEDRIEKNLAINSLSEPDRRLVRELCLGVIKWQLTLDWFIARKTRVPPDQHTLSNILRLGIYQIVFLTKIPDHAAVNEMVELTKQIGHRQFSGLVNAVLRTFARERESARETLKQLKQTQPHIGYSHPQWLYERWASLYGRQNAVQLLKWNNIPSRTYARVNTLKTTAETLVQIWNAEDVKYKPLKYEWTPQMILFEIKKHPLLRTLNSLKNGLFYIQDPSTLMAPGLLEPKPGEKILDFCAAPGGKTTYIAQLTNNNASIYAYDNNAFRIELLKDNISRLGVKGCRIIRAGEEDEIARNAPYDKILVDVPCSNTGVMRRRVELRWRLKPQKFKLFQKTQLEILNKASLYVKDGGVLVYSTCSIDPEENQEVVKKFIEQNPRWRLDCEKSLIPFRDGVDGAYAARLVHG